MLVSKLDMVARKYAEGNFQSAIDAFAEIKHLPQLEAARVYATVAQCHYRLGQSDAAADYFVKASEASSSHQLQLQFCEIAFELHRKAGSILKGLDTAERLLNLKPRHQGAALFRRHHQFDFLMLDKLKKSNEIALAGITAGDDFFLSCELPFNNIHWCGDERINAKILAQGSSGFSQAIRAARRKQAHEFGDKLRIGYLSNDFSSAHATMILLQGVIDLHDRETFDVTLYCYTDDALTTRDDGFRERASKIVSIGNLTDQEAHDLIRKDQIDILVDLKGHTKDARVDLINLGLAPIQVAWLGFPGSGTGIDCDYIIGDPIVTPDSSMPYYHEKFCRLPECYQPNDNIRRSLPPPARRHDLLLPEDKVVFASFNNIKKISPETFSAWVRILTAVPESILWILCREEVARRNFRHLMMQEGIAESRIIFADPAGYDLHIARLQAADIALDTFPCCGHTTTSDCLWAGLPTISVKGSNFSSRVSESLSTAVGLPELVAENVDGYVALAIELAKDQIRLGETRRKLATNRFMKPLFDTERFTRHLEKAYEMMVRRTKAGLDPDHLDVPPLPTRPSPFR
jgi:predicted O-linked N-acetylglucosamine transferase (SPINDLY family)